MLPWLSPEFSEQMQTLKNHRGFLGTLTCLTPKKKGTYMLHTTSPVKMCLSQHYLAAYNKISAAYFTLVRLLFRTRFGLCCLVLSPACLPFKNISSELTHTYLPTCRIRLHVRTCHIGRDQWIITQWNIDK